MKYKWTLVGFLLGLVTRRPQLMMIGVVIGAVLDAGLYNRLFKTNPVEMASNNPDHKSPYQVLDVDPQASNEDVDAAYRRQMAQYHPDKVDGAAKEIRELAEKRASEINAAYDQIQKIRGKK
jgi:DnaJ-domain-containing protein 1